VTEAAALQRHVHAIAEQGNVELVISATRRPRAIRSSPSRGRRARVVVLPVRGQVSYLVALHELGHVLSRGNASLRQLEREADAWRFALRHSLVEPTAATARSLLRSLDSYLRRAEARARRGNRIRATIPDPASDYWQLRAELRARAHRYDVSTWRVGDHVTPQAAHIPRPSARASSTASSSSPA
jgi:hypothetical protein